MKFIKYLFLLPFLLGFTSQINGQIIQRTGYIYSDISSKISTMPGDSGNHYLEPDSLQLKTWERTLSLLFKGNYNSASDSANQFGYNLVQFTDTFNNPHVSYYILENSTANYWGTYVYNPNYCRPLVIQSPHSKKDANIGNQGIHIFRKTNALFFQVNGTNRCNSSLYSNCSGNTTGCSNSSTSEPYRISDLAHTSKSIFQKTTEVLLNTFSNSYFIQLHGFTKLSSDPYLILSNGTQQASTPDYHSLLATNLVNEDSVLTYKIAHKDLNWTRLRGFWNTQGRLINGSINSCNINSNNTNGRFLHIEQERIRLRSNVSGWNKVSNALNNTFICSLVQIKEKLQNNVIKAYPNPSNNFIKLEFIRNINKDYSFQLMDLQGNNYSKKVIHTRISENSVLINISNIPNGLYLIKYNNSTIKFIKK
jgi:hypothetical protein